MTNSTTAASVRGTPGPTRRSPAGTGRAAPGDRTGRYGRGGRPADEGQAYRTAGATALATAPRPDRGTTAPDRAPLRVAPPAPVAAPRAPFVALVLAIVITGVLGILVLNTKINENAFRLDHLRTRQAALDQQEEQLNQQLADQESPNSLAAAARRLGLVPAGTPAFITLPDGRVLGVPQPTNGTPSITRQSPSQPATAGH